MNSSKRATVDTAKALQVEAGDHVIDLPYGVRAKIVPVSARLIEEVMSRVRDPEVPLVEIEGKDKPEPNPSDPIYLKNMREAERERGNAGTDAMLMFGLEIESGLEENKAMWLKKLQMMERMGSIDMGAFDIDDPIDLEFVYKRYIAAAAGVFERISAVSGVSAEGISKAEAAFPGAETR